MREKSRLAIPILVVLIFASACTSTFTVTFPVVGTRYNQYFAIRWDEFQEQYNTALPESVSQLEYLESSSGHNVYLSDNGDTWKILLTVATEDDIQDAVDPSENPAGWIDYIHEVELDLYSVSEQDAIENGQYIRALIALFTPGAEEEIEDVLGIYGTPKQEAIIGENVTRATYGTVSYTYIKDKRFQVNPYDEELYAQVREEPPAVIQPN